MKVGDMVKYRNRRSALHGIIIEVGVYVGRKNIKVLWNDGLTSTEPDRALEVISGSR